jgi:hypothetical protein
MSQHVDPASITPVDSPLTYEDIMSSPFHAGLFTPTVDQGGVAPDFTLERVDLPGANVCLGDVARNQPVALIFGSYT